MPATRIAIRPKKETGVPDRELGQIGLRFRYTRMKPMVRSDSGENHDRSGKDATDFASFLKPASGSASAGGALEGVLRRSAGTKSVADKSSMAWVCMAARWRCFASGNIEPWYRNRRRYPKV